MRRASKLTSIVGAQEQLRMLDELELIRCREDLADAVAARQHLLEKASVAASRELAWVAGRTNASRRIERGVEAAVLRVFKQEAELAERALTCLSIIRLFRTVERLT